MVAPIFFKSLYAADQYYFTSRHWYMEQSAISTFSTIQKHYAALYTVRTGQTQSIGSLGRVSTMGEDFSREQKIKGD